MADNVMTIQQYLNGKVRNITVSDDAVATIILDANIAPRETGLDPGSSSYGSSYGSSSYGSSSETSSGDSSSVPAVAEPVTKDTDVTLLTERERELCLAWLYVWIAGSPTQTGSTTEEDADWKHTEGGERMSANVLKHYLDMANDIFEKYDLPLVGEEKWGFVGRGFCNPRNTNPRRWR